MTSDDQHFLDLLSSVSKDIRKFSTEAAEATDRQIDLLASKIRSTLSNSPWLPESARPKPQAPPLPVPTTLFERLGVWISRNRALTAAIVAFFGTGAVLVYYQRNVRRRSRRAKRAGNGARKEVVVVAGPASAAVTKSLAMDLEKRGFIVYVVVHSVEEEQEVDELARGDVRPLNLELVEPLTSQLAIERFNQLLATPHGDGTSRHLQFTGLVLVPDLVYPSGPIETVSAELWSDALTAKVVGTVATTQAFLPTVCAHKARVLVLTPSIVPSLRPAFHGVETAVVGALEGFTHTLQRELGTLGIPVTQLRLGSFDCSTIGERTHMLPLSSSATLMWPLSARNLYAQNFLSQGRIGMNNGIFTESGSSPKGSSLRELHHAVFDNLTQRYPQQVVRVGRGSLIYDLVGRFVPGGLVGWILGMRRVSLDEVAQARMEDSVAAWEKVERSTTIS
ncbi:DUF1776-domain-containing protein [Rhizodiscina lignyota]|uniref:DUF1776-domain-containing protein n=1 Tax=Rhizodiscina lignyota TaxID=1504668 RepID=A0A9P4M9K6_9PEZI|nr:DUF1776-domain-containing protein [Rhizodiscina lignyota]